MKVKTRYNGTVSHSLKTMNFNSFKPIISPSYKRLMEKYAESQRRIAMKGHIK